MTAMHQDKVLYWLVRWASQNIVEVVNAVACSPSEIAFIAKLAVGSFQLRYRTYM